VYQQAQLKSLTGPSRNARASKCELLTVMVVIAGSDVGLVLVYSL